MSPDGPIGVLCLESNEGVCEALKRLLCPPRFVWLGAVTSREEVDQVLVRLHPGLLVIGAASHEWGGTAWLRRVRGMRPGMRVALLTAEGNPDQLAEALWSGVDGLLSKLDDPATIPALLEETAAGHIVIGPEVRRLLAARGPAPAEDAGAA